MNDRDTRENIVRVMSSSQYKWRTPRGIAKDSGLPLPKVLDVLERSGAFVRARKPNSRGEVLYSTKDRYKAETPLVQRVLGAITNKIGE